MALPLMLPQGEVHLWLAFEEEIVDAGLLRDYRSLLNDEERTQIQRFHFQHDRHRYLITRALVRTVLSRYRLAAPTVWRFTKNEYGRPQIEYPRWSLPPLWFNLSHTRGLVACAIASVQCVGVDTEAVDRKPSPVDIADRYFSPLEVRDLNSGPAGDQPTQFFHYWTLKESYIKAQGMGLSIPLDQFSFDLQRPGTVQVSFHWPLNDCAERLHFWLLRPSPRHVLAVCCERTTSEPMNLVARRIVPLSTEEIIPYPIVRQSELLSDSLMRRTQ